VKSRGQTGGRRYSGEGKLVSLAELAGHRGPYWVSGAIFQRRDDGMPAEFCSIISMDSHLTKQNLLRSHVRAKMDPSAACLRRSARAIHQRAESSRLRI
jgi:hypothetical protein